jgi:hypothetical protein
MAPLKSAVLVVLIAAATPSISTAQVYLYETPPPQVTAAGADWLVSGEAIFYEGDVYVPSGPDVFFDVNVMARTGVFRTVPLYEDRTLEPHSIVYVPVGWDRMRPYQLIRWGDLAGTTGSRTPYQLLNFIRPYTGDFIRAYTGDLPRSECLPLSSTPRLTAPETAYQPTTIESIPPPDGNRGMWVEFAGSRWYTAGPAVTFSADRFTPIGDSRGFAVYRRTGGSPDEIYMTVTANGLVAPYRR